MYSVHVVVYVITEREWNKHGTMTPQSIKYEICVGLGLVLGSGLVISQEERSIWLQYLLHTLVETCYYYTYMYIQGT